MSKNDTWDRRTACLKALEDVAAKLGHSPTIMEYTKHRSIPSSTTIAREFGSWNAAKKEAGLEVYSERTRRDYDHVLSGQCFEMRDAYRGSYTAVAREFGVSLSTARYHIRGDCTHLEADGHAAATPGDDDA